MKLKNNLAGCDSLDNKIDVLSVVGPTASGKTKLSVELAKALNGEIVSADSMQIYKGMDIGTAKPTFEEMQGIPHHLMGFLDSKENFSVAIYVEMAHKIIADIHSKGKLPIVTGGTGLYVDSLLNSIKFFDNTSDDSIRDKYSKLLEEKGLDYLLEKLKKIDYETYEKLLEQRNAKRIIRALEFFEVTGKTISEQNRLSKQDSPYNPIKIGLTCRDRQVLYDRINLRVDLMLKDGLLEEAEKVLNSDLSNTAEKAIGYKELIPYFKGESSLDECVEVLKMNTRRYAKRQLTWFRRDQEINWIYIDEHNSFKDILNKALSFIN